MMISDKACSVLLVAYAMSAGAVLADISFNEPNTIELDNIVNVVDSSSKTAVFTSVADCVLKGFERDDCVVTQSVAQNTYKEYLVSPKFKNLDVCKIDYSCESFICDIESLCESFVVATPFKLAHRPVMEGWQVGIDEKGNMTAESLPVYLEKDSAIVRSIGNDKVEPI